VDWQFVLAVGDWKSERKRQMLSGEKGNIKDPFREYIPTIQSGNNRIKTNDSTAYFQSLAAALALRIAPGLG